MRHGAYASRMGRFPDYSRSLVALSVSIARYFGVEAAPGGRSPPFRAQLPELDAALAARPERIILLAFDGLGVAQLERYLPGDAFLRRHLAAGIDSVFPPTTAAAMNSLYSGLTPAEHGWLGWSLHFREAGRSVDVFPRVDSLTKESVLSYLDPWKILEYMPILDAIDPERGSATFVSPSGISIPGSRARHREAASLGEWCEAVLESAGMGYTLGYWPEPDYALHRSGPDSPDAFSRVRDINDRVDVLSRALSPRDLLVVVADHGHVDVASYADIGAVEGLSECLVIPPFLEARAAMFFVRAGRQGDFERLFLREFGADFRLFSRAEMLREEPFGPMALAHPRTDGFVGDYLAVATGNRALKHYAPRNDHSADYPSHHAGLTEEELVVPLVLYRGTRSS